MKELITVLWLFTSYLLAAAVAADNFPQSYVNNRLEKARKQIHIRLDLLKPGQLLVVEYVDRPIFIYWRTSRDISDLKWSNTSLLADPFDENMGDSIEAAYESSVSEAWARLLLVTGPRVAKLRFRSKREDVLVIGGWGPQSGCVLHFIPSKDRESNHVVFHDSCVDADYDSAGRAFKRMLTNRALGLQARFNLDIPPHHFLSDSELVIGIPPTQDIPSIKINIADRYINKGPTEKLITAALFNDIETARRAIREGAITNYFVQGIGSPFDAAVLGSSMELINFLVKNGARPTPNSRRAAALINRQDVLKLITELEAKP